MVVTTHTCLRHTADNSVYAVRYPSPKCSASPRTSHTRKTLGTSRRNETER